MNDERIGVVGLGYVGLPVAVALARRYPGTIGFDIDSQRVAELREGYDRTREVEPPELETTSLTYSAQIEDLRDCTAYVVAVPTPIDGSRRPDLSALRAASRTVGQVLSAGDLVIYESTVYPGATREVCLPILLEVSGLSEEEVHLGYSPERINPGDRVHRMENIVKVVSGDSEHALGRVADIYGSIVTAGIHRAPSIEVAEAAKVIENTQRDLNIALMNELALVFERLGIRTTDVLEAAGTKWNFLPFRPGLVGGHCIGVDPYYLTARAESVGYHPNVILAGRRVNDSIARFIAVKTKKLLVSRLDELGPGPHKVTVLGTTFKENVPDTRNSCVPELASELRSLGVEVSVLDPLADADEVLRHYGEHLRPPGDMSASDAIVLAVAHEPYLTDLKWLEHLKPNGVVVDVKSAIDRSRLPDGALYWSL